MANQTITALVLTGAIALGLCGVSALAADPEQGDAASSAQQEQIQQEQAPDTSQSPDTSVQEAPEQPEQTEEGQPEAPSQPEPDPEGTLSFANVDSRVRAGNINSLVLEESIAQVESLDYETMQEDLREALNAIAEMQWIMTIMPGSSASQSLQTQYDALRQQFDDLKEGKLQRDNADMVRQLRNTQDSLVMLAQSMYIQLSELQATDGALERGLAALDRQIEELELRYELGQISALTLQQTKAARTSLVSQRETLASSARSLTMNLESMIGAELTGTLRLAALPQLEDEALDGMDVEADLAAAKEASYTLYAAQKTLDDAEETYKDAGKLYNYDAEDYRYIQAQHAWQGAQYTYQGAVQSFELSFRTLYAQVKDYEQVLQAAETALAVELDNYRVDQLKFEQGTISQNALLTAQDDLLTAQDTVNTARRNLFSAYNNYRWAVDYGILASA